MRSHAGRFACFLVLTSASVVLAACAGGSPADIGDDVAQETDSTDVAGDQSETLPGPEGKGANTDGDPNDDGGANTDGGTNNDGGTNDDGGTNNDGGTVVVSDDPFDSSSCAGSPMTKPQAIAHIGAGNAFREIAAKRPLLRRTRSCNQVTGCGAWSAPAPAKDKHYMASGSDNYNVDRGYDVALFLKVAGTEIAAVVEDASMRDHCAGCTPSGPTYDLSQASAVGTEQKLYYYYRRWTHTTSGFVVMPTWASKVLGSAAKTSWVVTDDCARLTIRSDDDEEEVGVLYRY